ncbi:MAG: DUF58 domain-containing protein [Gemmatimonadetes bacterium]|nr:DUF58 domain-containing protein [Gemmatimonadota bacterium]
MIPLPSKRFLLLLAVLSPLFLLGAAPALAVDALLLLAAVADALLAPRRRDLRVERHSPARLSLGATGEVELVVSNATDRSLRLRATDDLPPLLAREGVDTYELTVGPRHRETVRYRVRAAERGDASLGDLHLRVSGPLGLVWVQRRERRSDPVRVQPGVLEVRRYRLLGLRNRLHEAGIRNVRQRGEGGSFESLREYVRGDDPRTLDWKASARRGTLTVRQYEAERRQNVLLAIDAGRLMTQRIDGRERIDHALSAALLLADVAAQHGDRVGLLVFADRVEQYLPPARVSLSRLADALGSVQARMVEPNYPAAFTYLAKQLRRRSLLVIFTDVIDAAASGALVSHLIRSAGRHLPLAVALRNPELEAVASAPAADEPAVFRRAAAEELLQARAAALTAMQRAGVLVADARPQDAAPAVVNRYLEAKRFL